MDSSNYSFCGNRQDDAVAMGVINKMEGERVKATIKENTNNFDMKLDTQRKNQLRKLRDVMNARRMKKMPGKQAPQELQQFDIHSVVSTAPIPILKIIAIMGS